MNGWSDRVFQANADHLRDADQMCQELLDTLDGDPYDIGLSAYRHKAAVSNLEHLSDAFSTKAKQLEDLLEARRNEKMDNFRNRRITNADHS